MCYFNNLRLSRTLTTSFFCILFCLFYFVLVILGLKPGNVLFPPQLWPIGPFFLCQLESVRSEITGSWGHKLYWLRTLFMSLDCMLSISGSRCPLAFQRQLFLSTFRLHKLHCVPSLNFSFWFFETVLL